MNSQKFRKHRGGVYSVVKMFKVLLVIAIVGFALATLFSIFSMFTREISMFVTTRDVRLKDIIGDDYTLTSIRGYGVLTFKTANWIQWLFIPRYNDLDAYTSILSLFITLQLFYIFKEINLENPFYDKILIRITRIYQLIFFGTLFVLFRHAYLLYLISNHGDHSLRLLPNSFSSFSYFSVGGWVIVYLFAYVYKKGVVLQRDNDLTI